MTSGRPLRVGALLDSETAPRWVEAALGRVHTSEFADLALLAIDTGAPRTPRGHRGYRLYEAFDRLVYRRADDPFAPIELGASFPDAERIELDLRDRGAEALARHGLDVLVQFTSAGPHALADAAQHGVWRFHFGDVGTYSGGPSHFWEMYEEDPLFATALLAERPDGTHVLYQSYAATDPVSLQRGRAAAYWKTSAFLARRLSDLHAGGWERIESLTGYGGRVEVRAQRGIPSAPQVVGHIARVSAGIARRRARRSLYREQWYTAYRPRERADAPPTLITAPDRRAYFADPMLIDGPGGATLLFLEEFVPELGRGVVSYTEIAPDGGHSQPRRALERPYHLSYPFVFRHAGDTWMIPETSAARRIELYRAARFPDEWELVATLIDDIVATDATLIEHEGRLWLFAAVAEPNAGAQDELCLFSADALTGPWIPHPMNPVVSDVRRARPAGAIRLDEPLVRPAQDCSRGYGYAVALNRIEVLTRTDYREAQVGRIGPDWRAGNVATHTYAADDRWEALDARAWRPRNRLAEWLYRRSSSFGEIYAPNGGMSG